MTEAWLSLMYLYSEHSLPIDLPSNGVLATLACCQITSYHTRGLIVTMFVTSQWQQVHLPAEPCTLPVPASHHQASTSLTKDWHDCQGVGV